MEQVVWKQKIIFLKKIYKLQYSMSHADNINTDKYKGFPPNNPYFKTGPLA